MARPPRCATGYAEGSLEQSVVRAVRDALAAMAPDMPTMAVVTVSAPGDPEVGGRALGHAGALLSEVSPDCAVLGSTAHGVLAGSKASELAPAVSVWLASWPGARPRPFRIAARRLDDGGIAVHGLPEFTDTDRLAIMIADPFSTPIDEVLGVFDRLDGSLPVVGGLASAASQAGNNRLLLDGAVLESGAVGLILDDDAPVRTVVSQGCRPVGEAMTVTSARGSYLVEMASRPALERIKTVVESLPAEDQALAVRGLQMGIARIPDASGDSAADYLMRAIIGVDPTVGAITVGDEVPVGSVVRLHLRDADSAEADLQEVVRAVADTGPIAGALLITCNGRGRAMFTTPGHDGEVVSAGLKTEAVAGFFAAGEIGPVGGVNHVHGFTAVLMVVAASPHGSSVEVARQVAKDAQASETDIDLDAELAILLDAEPLPEADS
jgi:small ligand-binding sensory domain FIST